MARQSIPPSERARVSKTQPKARSKSSDAGVGGASTRPSRAVRHGTKSAVKLRAQTPADPRAAILTAAGELLDECGTDGLSTTAVARRANVSTGTVYKEFRDKQEILRALMLSLMTERGDSVTAHYRLLAKQADWRAIMDEATRKAFQLRKERPGGRSTRRALQSSPELWQWDLDHTRALAKQLAQALRKRKPLLSTARAEQIALVSLTMTIALFDLANLDPKREHSILEEAIAARNAYLSIYLD
ncbi:MAG: TetR/AcrR family transcriptional regulator [Burkholderiaceae bacterium]